MKIIEFFAILFETTINLALKLSVICACARYLGVI